ncbi:MAG TPA: DUF1223 domain-containing protein [Steroidobacteraceae bacterium]
MRTIPIITLVLALAGSAAIITVADAAESTASPVLVELFTAEGCSSCPPADAFLMQLDAHQPIPGVQLIVLSEHVTYWNDSWPDPFASGHLTARQEDYVRALKRPSAYTPQLIVDGTAEIRLSNPQDMERIFRAAAASPKIPVSVASVKVESGHPAYLSGEIQVDGNSEQHKADVYLALALDRVETKVSRGENRGKTLAHVAVVEYLSKLGRLNPGQKFDQTFRVPLERELASNDARLIVFVQEGGAGRVIGSTLKHTARPE